jgi:hypothetical protein
MITGGGGHHSPLPLLRGEVRDEVDSATNLKGSGGRMVFVLDVDFGVEELVELRIRIKRSLRKVPANDVPRL